MKRKYPMPIDGDNIMEDWIYDNLPELPSHYISSNRGSYNLCAFYRDNVLWEARWYNYANQSNIMWIEAVTPVAEDKIIEMEAHVHSLLDWDDGENNISCTTNHTSNTIEVRIYSEMEE